MRLQVLDEKHNPALQRKELTVAVDYEGKSTPKLAELSAAISKQLGVDLNAVDVRKLVGSTGAASGTAKVHVWASPDVMQAMKLHKKAKQAKAEASAPAK